MVTFPALKIVLKLEKNAFSILGIPITWYAILITSAFLLAIIFYKIRDGLYSIKFEDVLTLAIYTIPISIICARLYYVLFNLDYFINNPQNILNIRQGGLAIYGGIIRRNNYNSNILQNKKHKNTRFVRLYCAKFSPADKQ